MWRLVQGLIQKLGKRICVKIWLVWCSYCRDVGDVALEIAWHERIKNLVVESDSKVLIVMVNQVIGDVQNFSTLIRKIRRITKRNWHIKFNHTRRDGNYDTDWIANYSLTLNNIDLSILLNLVWNKLYVILPYDKKITKTLQYAINSNC